MVVTLQSGEISSDHVATKNVNIDGKRVRRIVWRDPAAKRLEMTMTSPGATWNRRHLYKVRDGVGHRRKSLRSA